ncbi:ATPase [Streptomyces longisporoflavus]|uniref:ATP-binding protein n=1 Tax=Streptomyces longisporoflavus TaxID=28044 RepID=UPI00167F0D1F|nr:ATP-binding protein [Streptomyces longisporoflavus]GGV69901.1 ATPase [Streptomyces longisporoflavus]
MSPSAPGDPADGPSAVRSQALTTRLRLPGDSERTPGRARAYLGVTLADWGVCETVRADLQLIVSELATNAVTCTRSSEITVEITLTDDEAAVSVADHGPHRHLRARHVPPDAESGRGLLIVQALASRWGQSRDDAGGTTVHAAITLPAQQSTSLLEGAVGASDNRTHFRPDW